MMMIQVVNHIINISQFGVEFVPEHLHRHLQLRRGRRETIMNRDGRAGRDVPGASRPAASQPRCSPAPCFGRAASQLIC